MAQTEGKVEVPEELKDAERFYLAALEDQKPHLSTWYQNIALFMGRHWMDWNQGSQWLQNPQMASWKVRFVANLIMPTIRTEAAKILKSNPTILGVPSNTTEESKAGARVASRLMESKYYEDDHQRKLYNLVLWFLVCGSSFMWTRWDKKAGKTWTDTAKDPETGGEMVDPEGNPLKMEFTEGDVCDEVDGPFSCLMEPGASEDFNQHQRIMRVRIKDVEWIKDVWGVDVKPEPIDSKTMFQFRISSLHSAQNFSGVPNTQNKKNVENVVLLKEFYELPTKKFPKGRKQIYANGTSIEDGGLDSWWGGKRALPVGKFDHITIPGQAWGRSIIEDIGPINVLFNKMTSQTVENGNMLGRPKVLAPQGSLDEDTWTDQPGEVVEYRPVGGHKPEPYKPAEMPAFFINLRDSLPQLMAEVSGIFDVSKGKLPRRATSGKAIDLLQDADDTRMGLTIRNFGSSLERVQSIKLGNIKRNYREGRIIKKIGDNHTVEAHLFKVADLRDSDTVRIAISPALSRSAKVQIGTKLGEAGIIPPEMVMKIMELGDLNMVYDQDQSQINYAAIENFGMAKGELHEVMSYEPHDLHIKEHREFLEKRGPVIPDESKQTIIEHMQRHKEFLASLTSPTVPPGAGSSSLGADQPIEPGNEGGNQGGNATNPGGSGI